jgi:hypothetical protein
MHPLPREHVTSTPVATGIGLTFLSLSERQKIHFSQRELWCGYADMLPLRMPPQANKENT